jgi:hypothetical protein
MHVNFSEWRRWNWRHFSLHTLVISHTAYFRDTLIRKYCFKLTSFLLTPWRAVALEKLVGVQCMKTSPPFMEPDCSLPCSQEPTTGPFSEADESSPHHISLRLLLILSYNLLPSLPSTFFPSDLLTKILYALLVSLMCARCSTHLILRDMFACNIWQSACTSFNLPLIHNTWNK